MEHEGGFALLRDLAAASIHPSMPPPSDGAASRLWHCCLQGSGRQLETASKTAAEMLHHPPLESNLGQSKFCLLEKIHQFVMPVGGKRVPCLLVHKGGVISWIKVSVGFVFEICTPSYFSLSLNAYFKANQALNLWPEKDLHPCIWEYWKIGCYDEAD